MRVVYSFSELPMVPAVYAFYGRRGHSAAVYVGMASKLKIRIRDHLVRRNSSIVTGEMAASLNADMIGQVDWWEYPDWSNPVALEAAEIIAFDVLYPALRSTKPSSRESEQFITPTYRTTVEGLLRGAPSGRYVVPSLQDALERIEELEKRVGFIEQHLSGLPTAQAHIHSHARRRR